MSKSWVILTLSPTSKSGSITLMKQPTYNMSTVQQAIELLQRFAQFDHKMQVGTALSLLYIARFQDRDGGLSTGDLTKWLGLTPAAASRNTYYWGEGTPEMPHAGYELVSNAPDPMDRRKRALRLTPRGEAFIRQLTEAMDGKKER